MPQKKVTLGQIAVEQNSNEITAIPKLLDLLMVKGCTVSVDAIGCQKDIAKKIRDKEAEYVLQLKGNQQALLEETENVFNITQTASIDHQEDFGHGRVESRICSVITDLTFLDEKAHWKDLNSIIRLKRKTIDKQNLKERSETSYFISSARFSDKKFNQIIRKHWAIENNLHWSLDELFKEDQSLKKKGNFAKKLQHSEQNSPLHG